MIKNAASKMMWVARATVFFVGLAMILAHGFASDVGRFVGGYNSLSGRGGERWTIRSSFPRMGWRWRSDAERSLRRRSWVRSCFPAT